MAAHTDGERAAVLALRRQGVGPLAIIEATGLPERTVKRWLARWHDQALGSNDPADLEIASQDYRIAVRSGYLLEDWLDKAEEESPGLPLPQFTRLATQLSISRGISVDKLNKRKELGAGNVQVNIILETRERLRQEIEGKAIHIE